MQRVGATFRRISKCARLMRRYHARCVYKGIDDPKGKLLLCHTGDGMHVHIAWVNGTIVYRDMSRQNEGSMNAALECFTLPSLQAER